MEYHSYNPPMLLYNVTFDFSTIIFKDKWADSSENNRYFNNISPQYLQKSIKRGNKTILNKNGVNSKIKYIL